MKKLLLMVAFAMVAMVSSAQIYVGGNLGFSSDKNEGAKHATTKLWMNPEVGYVLDDVWSFGASFGVNYTKDTWDKATKQDGTMTWNFNPYARYTFYNSGVVSCFVDGCIDLSGQKDVDTAFGVYVRPGIALNVTENISLVSRVAALGWNNKAGAGSVFALDVDASIASVGVYYTF